MDGDARLSPRSQQSSQGGVLRLTQTEDDRARLSHCAEGGRLFVETVEPRGFDHTSLARSGSARARLPSFADSCVTGRDSGDESARPISEHCRQLRPLSIGQRENGTVRSCFNIAANPNSLLAEAAVTRVQSQRQRAQFLAMHPDWACQVLD
jgi:hypothetical protein